MKAFLQRLSSGSTSAKPSIMRAARGHPACCKLQTFRTLFICMALLFQRAAQSASQQRTTTWTTEKITENWNKHTNPHTPTRTQTVTKETWLRTELWGEEKAPIGTHAHQEKSNGPSLQGGPPPGCRTTPHTGRPKTTPGLEVGPHEETLEKPRTETAE